LIKASLSQSESFLKQWHKIRYWSQDESRMGLHTIQRRKLTGKGIKPHGKVQWDFIYLWLYGVVEPQTGAGFFYEFTHLDTVCFEKFLELFAAAYPNDLHIIQLDNGGFHNSLNLNIPENVILLFQPAYSPEVNPIERLWGYIKEQLKWLRFDGIEELREALQKELKNLTNEVIASLTGYPFILKGLSVANI
jgi:transposase